MPHLCSHTPQVIFIGILYTSTLNSMKCLTKVGLDGTEVMLKWNWSETRVGLERVPLESQSSPSQVPLDSHEKFLIFFWDFSGSLLGVYWESIGTLRVK